MQLFSVSFVLSGIFNGRMQSMMCIIRPVAHGGATAEQSAFHLPGCRLAVPRGRTAAPSPGRPPVFARVQRRLCRTNLVFKSNPPKAKANCPPLRDARAWQHTARGQQEGARPPAQAHLAPAHPVGLMPALSHLLLIPASLPTSLAREGHRASLIKPWAQGGCQKPHFKPSASVHPPAPDSCHPLSPPR